MNICGIYKIESPSGAVYVGQSMEIYTRWGFHKRMHKSALQPKLHNSFRKHGVDSHIFSIIHELPIDTSAQEITNYERFCIDQFREAGIRLLNMIGAEVHGRHSIETKIKMSSSKKGKIPHNLGKPHSPETRLKLSIARQGRVFSKETREKISSALKGRTKSDEHKRKLREVNIGKKRTIESRIKQSVTGTGQKRQPCSEERKRKIGDGNRGRIKSAETLKKVSDSLKRFHKNKKNGLPQ